VDELFEVGETGPSVASARTRTVTEAAEAPVVWVAAVVVAAWTSGAVAPELSSEVTSLPDFGVSYDLSLNHLIRGPPGSPLPQSARVERVLRDSPAALIPLRPPELPTIRHGPTRPASRGASAGGARRPAQ
jgi:hypothetical protein